MKFTKEQLSEALKVKLTNNGKKDLAMSDRSFNGKIERLFKRLEKASDNEDLELVDAVSEYLEDFQEDDNNVRNDNSKFVKEWREKHPDKKDDRPDKSEGNKDKLDLLLEEIQTLKTEREQEKKAKAVSDKRSSLKSALKEKNVKNEDWINDQLELIHIDTETNVEALAEKLITSYNKFSSNTPPDITPKRATGGSGNGIDPNLEKIRKMREEQLKREKEGV